LTNDRFGNANKAYSFNGINNYINIGNNVNPNQFSVSVWVYQISFTSNQAIVSKIRNESGSHYKNFEVGCMPSSNQIRCIVPNGSTWTELASQYTLNELTWTHIVVTYDGSLVKIFKNGVADATTFNTTYTNFASETFIGARPLNLHNGQLTPDIFFNGKIDDTRIYNRAISNTEVTQIYEAEAPPITLQTGLVAHYPFNGNANDESGNGNNGTVNGATLTTDRFGNANKAYSFDGNDWIEAPNSISLNSPALNKTLTISSWVKINEWSGVIAQDWGIILSKSFAGNSTCEFFAAITRNGGIYGAGTYNFSLNQWYHIVQTVERANNILLVKSYVNGQFVGSTTDDNYLLGVSYFTPQTNNLYIGADPIGYTEYCKGAIDDIRIYNRVLSESEISQLYDVRNTTIAKGVTVIVHGFAAPLLGCPTWTIDMANAIRRKAGRGNIFQNNPSTGQWVALGGNSNNPNDEIILLYDWADLSNNG
jgi:hypothetical protein